MAARNTRAERAARNTSGAGAARNTRASAQLDAFPRSDNQRARQSAHRKAVVSIRLSGAVITRLDDVAKLANASKPWPRVTRSQVIERAIKEWLKAKGEKQ